MITVKGNSAIYEGPTIDEMYTTGIEVNTLFHELNTNKWYYLTADTTWVEVPNTGGGGSGFTPTTEQLAAMNSGITETDVEQISINQNNISSLLLDGSGKTGDLNDIAVNEFAVYTNQATNLPSNSWFYVRTSVNSVYPSSRRLQEAFNMSTGVSYIRTMIGGEWSNWLQITNA